MKRLLLLSLLVAAPAAAQNPGAVYPPDQVGAPAFTGGSITSPLCGPDSANFNEPTFYFCSDRNTGMGNDIASPLGSPFGSVGGGVSLLSDGSGLVVYPDEVEFFTSLRLDDYGVAASGAYMYQEANNEIAFGRPGATGMLGGGVGASIHLYNLGGRDVADSEKVEMGWNTTNDTFEFSSQATGTGTARNFQFSGGTVFFPDGDKTAPAIAFSADPGVGIYRDSSNEINFASNGEEIAFHEWTGTTANHWFANPNTAINNGLLWLSGTATSNTLRFYKLDAGTAVTMGATNTYAYISGGVPDAAGFYTYAMKPDATLAKTGDIAWLGLVEDISVPTNRVSITGPTAPTGVSTITVPEITGTMSVTVAADALAFDPGNTATDTCAAAITDTATGVVTTDVISWTFSADPTSTTGYDPSGDLGYIVAYPTADTVNFKFCNKSGSAIDPGAVTLNWRVDR